MELQKIPLTDIDFNDHFFLITYPLDFKPLVLSIRHVGLLQPVVIRKFPSGKYQIVSGFKRALACRDLDFEAIEAFVYDRESLGDLEGFMRNLWDNQAIRPLNLVEKAIVLDKLLHQFRLNKQVVVMDYMPLLNLEPSPKILEGYLQLTQLGERIQQYLLVKEIPLKLALELSPFAPEDRNQLLSLALSLDLNANTLREFIALIEEVMEREGIKVENLLDDSPIQDILKDSILPIPQKTERVRKILKRRRYPRLTHLEDQLQEKFKQLKLPKEISITPPPFFEGDRLKVTFQFRDKKELEKILSKLHELVGKEEMEDILRWIKGKDGAI